MIEKLIRGKWFAMDVVINFNPHHIIYDRRKVNKNNPFKQVEAVGLAEKENWAKYPRETNSDDDMSKNSTSSDSPCGSPQHDLCNIVSVATQITPFG